MMLKLAAKLLATVLLALPLAACFDGTIEVSVTSATTARIEAVQVINADTYGMLKRADEDVDYSALDEFCTVGELTETEDGGATCTVVREGSFATLRNFNGTSGDLTFEPAGNGLVRVSMSTKGLRDMAGAKVEMTVDGETREMAEAYFAGHTMTIRIGGGAVTDTNLTLSKDKESAEVVYPLLDLVTGKAELPQEFYAVVRLP
ncbi:hypothetical protein ASG47_09275 [Devosia sp. Leaf420]|uniref:hypothetical protein n=1 Tax=Devosia sp. Leaf420 TaxID=1736374 RepID=UPI0007131DC9|nr:hypothetical protein [Devosia sp. Leaf420]KQT48525.1 hypothetical protein ASG47_09275 [Devosia sp. Leaf420]